MRSLAAGSFCALAVQEDGSDWGWGNAQDGVGFLPPTKRTLRVPEPVPVQDMGAAVRQAWMGGHLALYRTVDGSMHGAGVGLLELLARHALGNGEPDEDLLRQAAPLSLPGTVLAMAAAGHSSFAICMPG